MLMILMIAMTPIRPSIPDQQKYAAMAWMMIATALLMKRVHRMLQWTVLYSIDHRRFHSLRRVRQWVLQAAVSPAGAIPTCGCQCDDRHHTRPDPDSRYPYCDVDRVESDGCHDTVQMQVTVHPKPVLSIPGNIASYWEKQAS
jgi:hypothetical protein